MDIKKDDKAYIANTYSRFDLCVASGKGSLLYDEEGKKYIDLGSGIAVNSFGVADEEWKQAVLKQLEKVQHISNLYYTKPQVELAKMLCERTGMKKVFFGNSGAEANEGAIKIARKYGHDKYGDARPNIVTLKDSFHGRTITTLAATGQDHFHKDFGPFTPGFIYVEPDDYAAMEAAVEKGDVCGVMMELVQGEGGIHVLDAEYVKKVAELCGKNDVVLIIDEVQTGNGRTGTLYAYMQFGIMPDVVSTAKGIGGGLPLGAVLIGEKCENTLSYGDHGSTFGGNPICAAGAVNILERIDDKLLAEAAEKGAYIKSELSGAKGVKSVTGMGLMIGVETEKPASEVVKAAIEKGVVALTAKNKIRLLPALNIPFDTLKEGIQILKEVISQ